MKVPIYRKKEIITYSQVSRKDYELLSNYKWRLHPRGYAIATTTNVLMHRLIMNPTGGLYVDHINHNKLDNRRENLRLVTPKLNMANRRINKNNQTGTKGVQIFRDRYRVYVGKKYVGVYKDIKDAENAYKKAFEEHFYGEEKQ